jgi:hypothetical protein
MPAVDFALVQLEESPLSERTFGLGVTPNRVATEKLYVPHTAFGLKPNPAYVDRADEQRAILGAVPKLLESYAPSGSYSERCYLDDITWWLYLAGFTPVRTAGGALVGDPDTTTATGVNALNSAIINVGDTSLFESAGAFIMQADDRHLHRQDGDLVHRLRRPPGDRRRRDGQRQRPGRRDTKWVWTKRGGINAQTAQIILNYADEASTCGNGYAISDLSISGDGMIQSNLLGLLLQRLAVDGATVPSYTTQAVPPVRRGDLYLSWLANGGAIDDFSFAISNPLNPDRSLSLLPPSNFPDLMEYGDAQVKVTGSIPKRVLAAADIDALLNASTFAAKARWKTPKSIAATAYFYSMWLEMPAAQLTDGSFDDLANKRRHGGSYSFEAAYDEASGYDVRITVVNATAAAGLDRPQLSGRPLRPLQVRAEPALHVQAPQRRDVQLLRRPGRRRGRPDAPHRVRPQRRRRRRRR